MYNVNGFRDFERVCFIALILSGTLYFIKLRSVWLLLLRSRVDLTKDSGLITLIFTGNNLLLIYEKIDCFIIFIHSQELFYY